MTDDVITRALEAYIKLCRMGEEGLRAGEQGKHFTLYALHRWFRDHGGKYWRHEAQQAELALKELTWAKHD